jgi:hypothetical protein
MPFACESDNAVVTAAYGMADDHVPHVGLSLACYQTEGKPVVIISRLNPNDARAVAVALTQAAELVQEPWETFKAETESEGTLGD